MKRIPVVDIFRGLAVLGTLAIHLGPLYITTNYSCQALNWIWYKLWCAGGYGVYLFFVISGYLITRQLAENPPGLFQPDLEAFYARRAGRILPLVLLALLAGCLALPLTVGAPPTDLRTRYCLHNPYAPFSDGLLFISILFFFSNWYRTWLGGGIPDFGLHWDVFWTLSIEEQFYLFYPWVLRTLGRTPDLQRFLLFLVLLQPALNLLAHEAFPHWRSVNSFCSFGSIALGCLLHLAEEKYKEHLAPNPKACWSLCAVGTALMAWILFHSIAKVYTWVGLWGTTLVGIGFFLFLLGGLHLSLFRSKLWAPLTLPGQLSFGIYLLHSLVLYFLWNLFAGLGHFQAFFLFAAITTFFAWVCYRFYETPMNRRFRRWFSALWALLHKPSWPH